MGSTLGSHESAKRDEKHPYRCCALPQTRVSDPSNYFPNSFSRTHLINTPTCQRRILCSEHQTLEKARKRHPQSLPGRFKLVLPYL
jgi:hypothetical protein